MGVGGKDVRNGMERVLGMREKLDGCVGTGGVFTFFSFGKRIQRGGGKCG